MYGKKSDKNTKLLLHFDGNYSDSSASKISVGNNPNANAFVDGVFGQSVNMGSNYPTYNVGISGNITIEFFIKMKSQMNSDWMGLFGSFEHQSSTGTGIAFRYTSYGNCGVQVYTKNGQNEYSSGWLGILSTGTWYHIAITVTGGICKVYKDGTLVTSFTANYGGLNTLYFGRWALNPSIYPFNADIDEFRISDIVRYTANFTPPDKPF